MCFSIGNGPLGPANYQSCFSIPVGSILELLGSSSKSTVVHHPSVQLDQSSVLFCTIRQYCSEPFISTVLHHSSVQLHHSSVLFYTICPHSSAPFVSSVMHHSSVQFCTIRQFSSAPFISYRSAPFVSSFLHHSLATILCHVIMLFYNSASTNNLATDANTLCRLFNSVFLKVGGTTPLWMLEQIRGAIAASNEIGGHWIKNKGQ